MKIQVGQTYKDGNGNDVLIECKLVNSIHDGYPYIGTYKSKSFSGSHHWCTYNEKGEHSNRLIAEYDLKEKPIEGYANVYANNHYGRVHKTRESALKAKNQYWKYIRTIKVLEAGDE